MHIVFDMVFDQKVAFRGIHAAVALFIGLHAYLWTEGLELQAIYKIRFYHRA